MLPRVFITPENHWAKQLGVPISQGVRAGDLLFISGQVAIESDQSVFAPDDLISQTRFVVGQILSILKDAGLGAGDLVQLRGFYASDACSDERAIEAEIASVLGQLDTPGPVLTLVPMPVLRPEGIVIEIEAIAMRGQNGEVLPRTIAWDAAWPGPCQPFSHALRVGTMIFTSGVTAEAHEGVPANGDLAEQCHIVMRRLGGLLSQLGAGFDDVVKSNIYNAEPGTKEDWARPALVRASYYNEPGPAATGISGPSLSPKGVMTKKDVVAMLHRDGTPMERQHVWPKDHWDWTVHLPYRHGLKAGDLVFLGGQVPLRPDASVAHVGDITRQTEMSMEYIRRILAELGMDFGNILRMNTFFAVPGAEYPDEAEYQKTLKARFGCFDPPGPATTAIPVPYLAYKMMNIEIDVIAMA